MGKIIFELNEELDRHFRIALTYLKGSEKGALKDALQEAVLLWLQKNSEKLPSDLQKFINTALNDFNKINKKSISLPEGARVTHERHPYSVEIPLNIEDDIPKLTKDTFLPSKLLPNPFPNSASNNKEKLAKGFDDGLQEYKEGNIQQALQKFTNVIRDLEIETKPIFRKRKNQSYTDDELNLLTAREDTLFNKALCNYSLGKFNLAKEDLETITSSSHTPIVDLILSMCNEKISQSKKSKTNIETKSLKQLPDIENKN